MKKLVKLTTMMMMMSLFLVGCSPQKPGDEVISYFDELTTIQTEEIYEDPFDEAVVLFLSNISDVEILSETINEDKTSASVQVKLTGPNYVDIIEKSMSDGMMKGFVNVFSGEEISDQQIADIYIKNINDSQVEYREGYVNLTKIDKKWQVEEDDDLYSLIYSIDNMSELSENSWLFE